MTKTEFEDRPFSVTWIFQLQMSIFRKKTICDYRHQIEKVANSKLILGIICLILGSTWARKSLNPSSLCAFDSSNLKFFMNYNISLINNFQPRKAFQSSMRMTGQNAMRYWSEKCPNSHLKWIRLLIVFPIEQTKNKQNRINKKL